MTITMADLDAAQMDSNNLVEAVEDFLSQHGLRRTSVFCCTPRFEQKNWYVSLDSLSTAVEQVWESDMIAPEQQIASLHKVVGKFLVSAERAFGHDTAARDAFRYEVSLLVKDLLPDVKIPIGLAVIESAPGYVPPRPLLSG